jgi:hypothetical protein
MVIAHNLVTGIALIIRHFFGIGISMTLD